MSSSSNYVLYLVSYSCIFILYFLYSSEIYDLFPRSQESCIACAVMTMFYYQLHAYSKSSRGFMSSADRPIPGNTTHENHPANTSRPRANFLVYFCLVYMDVCALPSMFAISLIIVCIDSTEMDKLIHAFSSMAIFDDDAEMDRLAKYFSRLKVVDDIPNIDALIQSFSSLGITDHLVVPLLSTLLNQFISILLNHVHPRTHRKISFRLRSQTPTSMKTRATVTAIPIMTMTTTRRSS